MEDIEKIEFHGVTISEYLNDELPLKAFKYYTRIYKDNADPDISITSVLELFEPILNIIKNNNIMIVDDSSLIIKNLKN